jgi:hypothetical protein
VVQIVFAPNFALEVDLDPALASSPDIPLDIDQFWQALSVLWYQPSAELGGVAGIFVPTDLKNVPPHLQQFWQALRPTFLTILDQHPTLVGRRQGRYSHPPDDVNMLSQFGARMLELDPTTKKPQWQLFNAEHAQGYAVWVLRQFFSFCTGPGFSI